MIKYHTSKDNTVIALLTDDDFLISEVQDALDLMADLGEHICNRLIVKESNLNSAFFDLKTGLAGEILQKFSTYGVKLAITGDFSKYRSTALQDFIRESNRGNQVFFLDNIDLALTKFSGYQEIST